MKQNFIFIGYNTETNEYITESLEGFVGGYEACVAFREKYPHPTFECVAYHQTTGIVWDDRIPNFDLSEEEISRIVKAEIDFHKAKHEMEATYEKVKWFPIVFRWIFTLPLFALMLPAAILAAPFGLLLFLYERIGSVEIPIWFLLNPICKPLQNKYIDAKKYKQENSSYTVTHESVKRQFPDFNPDED